jgi:hypothetical protein
MRMFTLAVAFALFSSPGIALTMGDTSIEAAGDGVRQTLPTVEGTRFDTLFVCQLAPQRS